VSDNNKIKYPIARSHPVIHACPQFRPIRRGARRRGLVREYVCKNGDALRIYLFHELDIADQSLLLSILAIARAEDRGMLLSPSSSNKEDVLIDKLALAGFATSQDSIMIKTTGFELLTELGKTTGSNDYKWLRESLRRLSLVNFERTSSKESNTQSFFTFNLLSIQGEQNENGTIKEIKIAINPLSARAILGSDQGYVLTHRFERNLLNSDEAKALHSALCGLVNRGNKRHLNIDTLADRVYARYDDHITEGAARKRRSAIIKASKEINMLENWTCEVAGKGKNSSLIINRQIQK
jgi:hypothetical protein